MMADSLHAIHIQAVHTVGIVMNKSLEIVSRSTSLVAGVL